MDDFDLSPDPLVPGLDVAGGVPKPLQSPQQDGGQKTRLARLMMLVPIALAKGGQQGLTGLLQGYQAGEQRRQQEMQQQVALQRQANQDARLDRADARAEQNAQFQQDQARSRFMADYAGKVGELDDPDALGGMLDAYGLAGGQLGIGRPALERVAMQVAKPDKITKNAAAKHLKELKARHGDKWVEMGQQMTYKLPYQDQPVTLEQLLALEGSTPQGPLQKPAAAQSDDGPLDRRHFSAAMDEFRQANGREPNPTEVKSLIEATRKAVGQADDRPLRGPDPSIADNRRFSMEQRLAAQWEKAVTPHREVRRQLMLMEEGLKRYRAGDTNGGSQAVLVTFQKILDPTSVVRESEYARTAAGQSMLNRIQGYADRLATGGAGLTDGEMAAMVETGRAFLKGMETFNNGTRQRLDRTARQYQLDPRMIFDDVDVAGGGGADPLGIR